MRQSGPGGHVGCVESASDGIENILVGRQRSCRRRTALERGGHKVARQNVEVGSVFAVAVAAKTMTAPAIPEVELLACVHMPVELAAVTFHLSLHCARPRCPVGGLGCPVGWRGWWVGW